MWDIFNEQFQGKSFPSREAYNRDVMDFSMALTEELGRVERTYLQANDALLNELDVEIKDEH